MPTSDQYPNAIEVPQRFRDGRESRLGSRLNEVGEIMERIQTALGAGIVTEAPDLPSLGAFITNIKTRLDAGTAWHCFRIELDVTDPAVVASKTGNAVHRVERTIYLPELEPILDTSLKNGTGDGDA